MRKQFIMSVLIIIGLFLCVTAFGSESDSKPQPEKGMSSDTHQPPPQAYEDCKGKKAGDIVQHTTPEGKVTATCEDSPNGLVARPNNKSQDAKAGGHPPQEKQP